MHVTFYIRGLAYPTRYPQPQYLAKYMSITSVCHIDEVKDVCVCVFVCCTFPCAKRAIDVVEATDPTFDPKILGVMLA